MAGSDRVPDPDDSKRAQGWKRAKPSTRAKWRSSTSAYRSVAQNLLTTADIVRDRDVTTAIRAHGAYNTTRDGSVSEVLIVVLEVV